jgi:GH43 family beta-xylosidase
MITDSIDADGADPWLLKYQGTYYYSKSIDDHIVIYRSRNITDIAAGESTTALGSGQDIEAYWAPEIHHLDGGWYIYFAAQKTGDDIHHTYVLSNTSADPFTGSWKLQPLKGMDDKFAIDGTVLETKRDRYFIWSGWKGDTNVRQDLYLARMESPTHIKNEKILISKPELAWERHGDPKVNEGPAALVHGSTANLAYSASGSWTNEYCIGLLTASVDDDLTDPDSWTKADTPIMSSANGIYGPGHNSFVPSPDDSETEIVYHSARWDGAGWNRSVRVQPVSFDTDGKLQTIKPLQSNILESAPAGEPKRLRFMATKADSIADGMTIAKDPESLLGSVLQGFESRSESASWNVIVPQTGTYTLFVWAKMSEQPDDSQSASIRISVDGDAGLHEETLKASSTYLPIVVDRQITAGNHTISLGCESDGNPVSIDHIEIMPHDA